MIKHFKSIKGSLTAEACITLSCFIGVAIFLMSWIGGLYMASILEEVLLESSVGIRSQVALYNSATGFPLADELVFKALVKKELTEALALRQDQLLLYDSDKILESLEVNHSSIMSANKRMIIAASIEWPMIFRSNKGVVIERVLVCRKWTDFVDIVSFLDKQGIEEVYMANHPSVYHTNINCRSIKNREKHVVKLKDIQTDFRECKFCQKERSQ